MSRSSEPAYSSLRLLIGFWARKLFLRDEPPDGAIVFVEVGVDYTPDVRRRDFLDQFRQIHIKPPIGDAFRFAQRADYAERAVAQVDHLRQDNVFRLLQFFVCDV